MPRMTVTAALAAILLCGPALCDDAGTDQIRARLLATPVWVYEWAKDIPTAPGKVDSGKVSFVEKDGKLIGVVDVGLKCSNEVRWEEQRRDALAWRLSTGAARVIFQAYRQARQRGESELTAFNAAADAALTLGRPLGQVNETARVLIDWAEKVMHE